jgi:alcohol dehydrogenase
VRENPTTGDVDACLAVARGAAIDTIIGLGGGSSIDTAKGCNFLLTNGGRMQDYWGVGKATKPMLPLIAVPTTAGTGSECQLRRRTRRWPAAIRRPRRRWRCSIRR